ncbi:hypothetical protein [Limnobacter sp.]|uniref:hypothetical protein n=1 Tax=Limnobacter sp. TaxID=2003368 RepID=UPI0025C03657|nr:hypothetical protein [Limnobacter sp.]
MKNESGSQRVAAYSERKKGAGYKRICAYVSNDTDKIIKSYIDMGFNQGEAIDAIALDAVNNNPRFGLFKILNISKGFENIKSISSEVKVGSKIYLFNVHRNGFFIHDFNDFSDSIKDYPVKTYLENQDKLIGHLIVMFYETFGYWPKRKFTSI